MVFSTMNGLSNATLNYLDSLASASVSRSLGSDYQLQITSVQILKGSDFRPPIYHTVMAPKRYNGFEVSIWSDIGNRKAQEDRFVFCPQLVSGRKDTSFFGVFDGTVGDFASENVKGLVIPHLLGSPPWPLIVELTDQLNNGIYKKKKGSNNEQLEVDQDSSDITSTTTTTTTATSTTVTLEAITPSTTTTPPSTTPAKKHSSEVQERLTLEAARCHFHEPKGEEVSSYCPTLHSPDSNNYCPNNVVQLKEIAKDIIDNQRIDILERLLISAFDWMYLNSDTELINLCEGSNKHYSSSTSVTVAFIGGYCCIGHLGDSRIALGYEKMGMLYGEFLTHDHKPNDPVEMDRIVKSGGSVEYLHNHNKKPFIRGGDFTRRKSQGDQPMQLQYSRAFGGKDLKRFGLSNQPDILTFQIDFHHHVLILASDGIWDVQSAPKAIEIVLLARSRGEHPALNLVTSTLNEQRRANIYADNLTVIAIFLNRGEIQNTYEATTGSTDLGISSSVSTS